MNKISKIFLPVILVVIFLVFSFITKNNLTETKSSLCQKGIALMEESKFEAALEALNQAIKIDPQYPKANYALAVCYLRMDPPDLVKARQYRQKAFAGGYVIPAWFDDYSKQRLAETTK